ncbi:L,D-transpeptidase family protein [Desulfovibrio inopinatus]|uniref:L,D-transpeptidase family protein n=1 Tax=Desulfovibrio inopinatus TaxID=102109 RepID=UPI000401B0E1|nr:L,D-transpeptidase family protein [Desulfovibrio inopinatus]
MIPVYSCASTLLLVLAIFTPAFANSSLSQSLQAVVVIADDMNTPYGEMQRFARSRPHAPWKKIGHASRVELGKNGLAWGRGIVKILPQHSAIPQKLEGDGRSPAGVFFLGHILATPEGINDLGFRHDVETITPRHLCVEDPASPYYNQLVNRDAITSPELDTVQSTLLTSGLFTYAIYVGQNQPHPIPGGGSCVYLHLKRKDGDATAGCTALHSNAMLTLLHWLNPKASPILVQIPASARSVAAQKTGLPLR